MHMDECTSVIETNHKVTDMKRIPMLAHSFYDCSDSKAREKGFLLPKLWINLLSLCGSESSNSSWYGDIFAQAGTLLS
ncbi:UNVERIFIED_CONTAM: hypothetical protein FKN15_067829 [Acipenser sinensis]